MASLSFVIVTCIGSTDNVSCTQNGSNLCGKEVLATLTIVALGVHRPDRNQHFLVGVVVHCNVHVAGCAKLLWQLGKSFD